MLSKIFNPTKLAVILLSLTLLYLDQFSKSHVMKNLDFFIEGYRVFPFLNFVFVTNKGISFGLLSEFNISFYLGVLSIFISALITVWILKSNKKSEIISRILIWIFLDLEKNKISFQKKRTNDINNYVQNNMY